VDFELLARLKRLAVDRWAVGSMSAIGPPSSSAIADGASPAFTTYVAGVLRSSVLTQRGELGRVALTGLSGALAECLNGVSRSSAHGDDAILVEIELQGVGRAAGPLIHEQPSRRKTERAGPAVP